MLVAKQLSLQLGQKQVLHSIDLQVREGDFLALLGANGAGKSSLLSLLSAERPLQQGSISLNGRALASLSNKELARQRAVLPQSSPLFFPFAAEEVVRMGRLPWGEGRQSSMAIVEQCLALAQVVHLAKSAYPMLSGGEKQRVQLARVLAQLWPFRPGQLLLLDECTASLDPLHQQQVFALAKWLSNQGLMVIAVVHDLQLAAQYANRLALLAAGRILVQGSPQQVLTPEHLHQAYHGFEVEVMAQQESVLLRPKTLLFNP